MRSVKISLILCEGRQLSRRFLAQGAFVNTRSEWGSQLNRSISFACQHLTAGTVCILPMGMVKAVHNILHSLKNALDIQNCWVFENKGNIVVI